MSDHSTEFKDLFSSNSENYAKFRPIYPDSLFEYLATIAPSRDNALDIGTGNGQAAQALTKYFRQIIAIDPSEQQLSKASQNSKINFRVGYAENTGCSDNSTDLITVAQAFHWFKHDEFFSEAKRILKPKGIVAYWCYGLAEITPEVDSIVRHLCYTILDHYWEPERQYVEEGYKTITLPMKEEQHPVFIMNADWSFEHLIGYLRTWSALQKYIKQTSMNPLESMLSDFKAAWGDRSTHQVRWELALRIGRKII